MAVTTKKQLENKLDGILKKALEKVALEVKKLWKQYIQERFYDLYPNPSEYVRTYQLLNSVSIDVVKKNGNKWEVVIFMDESSVEHPYLSDDIGEVFAFSADGWHGTNFSRTGSVFVVGDGINPNGTGNTRSGYGKPIRTEGRFFTELKDELRAGRLVQEFEKELSGLGYVVRLK